MGKYTIKRFDPDLGIVIVKVNLITKDHINSRITISCNDWPKNSLITVDRGKVRVLGFVDIFPQDAREILSVISL